MISKIWSTWIRIKIKQGQLGLFKDDQNVCIAYNVLTKLWVLLDKSSLQGLLSNTADKKGVAVTVWMSDWKSLWQWLDDLEMKHGLRMMRINVPLPMTASGGSPHVSFNLNTMIAACFIYSLLSQKNGSYIVFIITFITEAVQEIWIFI